jgi:SAM-dependent methyltransferase
MTPPLSTQEGSGPEAPMPREPTKPGEQAGSERGEVRQQSVREWLDFSQYVTEYRFSSYWHQLDWVFRTAPRQVLEIGVGPGLIALYLRAQGIHVCTVDMENALQPDICASVTNLPFADKSFDAILCCQVLEHLPFKNFDQCLRELRRVCGKRLVLSLPDKTPGLAMSIRVPNFLFWDFCLSLPAAIREPIRRVREHHWEIGRWGYSSRRITKHLKNAGFSLDRTYRVSAYPYHRFFILTPK